VARVVNALLLAMVALGYGLWFGVRLAMLPFYWLANRLR
jgi:hypothetical protein